MDLVNPANDKEDMWKWKRNLDNNELNKFKDTIKWIKKVFDENSNDEDTIIWLQKYLWNDFWKDYYDDYCDKQWYKWENVNKMFISKINKNILLKISTNIINVKVDKSRNKKIKLSSWITHLSWKKIKSQQYIEFKADISGIDCENYEIYWQILNTWKSAEEAWDLRWEIFKWKGLNREECRYDMNYEKTAYKWIHWVKCYLVKNEELLAESEKFYVNVN